MSEKIAFIGGGNMAASLIGGLIKNNCNAQNISVSEPNDERRVWLEQTYGVNVCSDNVVAAADASVIVLAVKPNMISLIAKQLGHVRQSSGCLIVSIAAGVRVVDIITCLGYQAPIVRCMPNTPALLGFGATALYANDNVSDEQKRSAKAILDSVGLTVWLEHENEIDVVTALSGSGPAYYFLFMESMIASAEAMGLNRDTAHALCLQTALGAVHMAQGQSLEKLRQQVTSPGGTTERALDLFAQLKFKEVISSAMQGARDKSISIADEMHVVSERIDS